MADDEQMARLTALETETLPRGPEQHRLDRQAKLLIEAEDPAAVEAVDDLEMALGTDVIVEDA